MCREHLQVREHFLAWSEGVRNGTVKKGDTMLMLGFGAGLTYAGICVKNTL